jgi:predicted RNA-binding protein with PUA-like domain
MAYWLIKSEPTTYSINDLAQESDATTCWEGVRNYQARNFMRDNMKLNDLAFYYHSSCATPGIVGIVKIVKEAYADNTALNPK